MTKEEYLRKVAEMQTDISAIKQEGVDDTKTCKNCIHQEVCYRYSYGLPENYADKCGDYLMQKSGKWIDYRDDGFVECPFCGHATNCEDDIDELHYCFYCGAKMVEPQERSDKE